MRLALPLSMLLFATAAQAGGPIIIEDTSVEVAPRGEDGRVPGWLVPVAIGVVLLSLLAGGDTCNSEPEGPTSPSNPCN